MPCLGEGGGAAALVRMRGSHCGLERGKVEPFLRLAVAAKIREQPLQRSVELIVGGRPVATAIVDVALGLELLTVDEANVVVDRQILDVAEVDRLTVFVDRLILAQVVDALRGALGDAEATEVEETVLAAPTVAVQVLDNARVLDVRRRPGAPLLGVEFPQSITCLAVRRARDGGPTSSEATTSDTIAP